MDTKETVWLLEHVYEVNNSEEIKFIGVFSSKEKANSIINELKGMPGFNKHPIDCFKVSEEIINRYGWKEGFISWEEANS